MSKLKFFRGERIVEFMELTEASMAELERNIVFSFPHTTKRQHATGPVQVQELKLVPYTQTNDLLVNVRVQSDGHRYDPRILILDVAYEDEDTPTNVTFTGSDGETYNVAPISMKQHDVKVSCTCLDFYYRFAVWNNNANSLYGNPPPLYRRKTETRPPVNPRRVPGICKHIIKSVQALRDARLVTV